MVCIWYPNISEVVNEKENSLANLYKRNHQSALMLFQVGNKGIMDSIKEIIFITLVLV